MKQNPIMVYEDVKEKMSWDDFEELANIKHETLIDTFKEDLKGLSPKTVKRHLDNIDTFLNFHLVRKCGADFESSETCIESFFSYTLKYKVLGISKDNAKGYGATLRKFYKSMAEHGFYPKEDLEETLEDIKMECSFLVEELDDDDFCW